MKKVVKLYLQHEQRYVIPNLENVIHYKLFVINLLQNFFPVFRCLEEDPLCRISAQDALDHPFFKDHALMPSTKDMILLPSHILQMFNVFKNEKYDDPKELEGKN